MKRSAITAFRSARTESGHSYSPRAHYAKAATSLRSVAALHGLRRSDTASSGDIDTRGTRQCWRILRGAQGQSKGGAAVAVAVGGVSGAVGDVASRGHEPVDAVKVIADRRVARDEDTTAFEGRPQCGEKLVLEGIGELAEFNSAIIGVGRSEV